MTHCGYRLETLLNSEGFIVTPEGISMTKLSEYVTTAEAVEILAVPQNSQPKFSCVVTGPTAMASSRGEISMRPLTQLRNMKTQQRAATSR